MTNEEALAILEKMTTQQFNAFLITLPERTQMLVRSGMSNWREVLPAWYVHGPGGGRKLEPGEIPF